MVRLCFAGLGQDMCYLNVLIQQLVVSGQYMTHHAIHIMRVIRNFIQLIQAVMKLLAARLWIYYLTGLKFAILVLELTQMVEHTYMQHLQKTHSKTLLRGNYVHA